MTIHNPPGVRARQNGPPPVHARPLSRAMAHFHVEEARGRAHVALGSLTAYPNDATVRERYVEAMENLEACEIRLADAEKYTGKHAGRPPGVVDTGRRVRS